MGENDRAPDALQNVHVTSALIVSLRHTNSLTLCPTASEVENRQLTHLLNWVSPFSSLRASCDMYVVIASC
jgi:hypothetical protein